MTTYTLAPFPKKLRLRDGSVVQIRPLEAGDEERLREFFLHVPEVDRFQFKHDVTTPGVVGGFCQNIDYRHALPLVAVAEGRILAEGADPKPRLLSTQARRNPPGCGC